jgi:hypothetical protein
VIVGLVPVGGITDSSASGAARAVAERVSRKLCSRPLDCVFEIGTTIDARQGIGEVLIVVSRVVDGGIDTNVSAFLRSTEMLAGRVAIAVTVGGGPRTPTWSTLASTPRCSRPVLPVCNRDSILVGAPSPRIAV